VHYLSNSTFLVLSRDGNGNGDDNTESAYKQIDLFSVSNATNIAGTAFDTPTTPVAPNGVLNSSVKPATYVSFVNMIDDDQLGRFALHNGGNNDTQLINPKWESLALAPVGDKDYPNDYFLFTAVRSSIFSIIHTFSCVSTISRTTTSRPRRASQLASRTMPASTSTASSLCSV
jgi:hypothetical protein